jgi:hypothetical protein
MISINVSDKQADGHNNVEVKVEGERLRCVAQLTTAVTEAFKSMRITDSEAFGFCCSLLIHSGHSDVYEDIMSGLFAD